MIFPEPSGLYDLHVHTTYSDGKNTPREYVEEALSRGAAVIGFSDHSYTAFDTRYCMNPGSVGEYASEIARLKEEYAGRIEILCGIEQDLFSGKPEREFDYVIGSVHYFLIGDEYVPVDKSAEVLKDAARKYFGGDLIFLACLYYEELESVVSATRATIIGHFDLIEKFNEDCVLFDTNDPRLARARLRAADALLATGAPFEINVGAISRGYRTSPYPSESVRKYLAERGAKFIFSSDCHKRENLLFCRDRVNTADGSWKGFGEDV